MSAPSMQYITNTADLIAGLLISIKAGHRVKPSDEILSCLSDQLSDILTELSKDVPHDDSEE